ncbi:MAG: septal ring lytic transglycosylase RlpA family protein [Synechococcus sp.]
MVSKSSLLLFASLGVILMLPQSGNAEDNPDVTALTPSVSAEEQHNLDDFTNMPDAPLIEASGSIESASDEAGDFSLKPAGESEEQGAVLPSSDDSASFPAVLKLGRLQNDLQEVELAPATLYSYEVNGRDAATVYLDGLPLLTFGERTGGAEAVQATPLEQATQLTAKLNLLARSDLDEVEIALDTENGHSITIDNEVLVNIDENVVLDLHRSHAGTAIAAVNRMRRLLQGAPPIGSAATPQTTIVSRSVAASQSGLASWYGPGFAGRLSANGEIFDPEKMTAAHKYLPFGTMVEVVSLSTGRSVVVRINDRGPFVGGRIIDLSAAAARSIGLMGAGVGPVELRILN